MKSKDAKRLFLRLFIGFLSLTAIVAIFSVLNGDFGEIQLKILGTTFAISAASICSMSCAAFIEKQGKELGILGIICSGIAASMVVAGIWIEVNSDEYWKTAVSFIVLSVALAHAFLLILPDLYKGHKWTQVVATLTTGILAVQIMVGLWWEIDEEIYFKMLAAVSILVVLWTLIIPILMKMGKGASSVAKTLILTRGKDGVYTDKDGVSYEVIRKEPGPGGSE